MKHFKSIHAVHDLCGDGERRAATYQHDFKYLHVHYYYFYYFLNANESDMGDISTGERLITILPTEWDFIY